MFSLVAGPITLAICCPSERPTWLTFTTVTCHAIFFYFDLTAIRHFCAIQTEKTVFVRRPWNIIPLRFWERLVNFPFLAFGRWTNTWLFGFDWRLHWGCWKLLPSRRSGVSWRVGTVDTYSFGISLLLVSGFLNTETPYFRTTTTMKITKTLELNTYTTFICIAAVCVFPPWKKTSIKHVRLIDFKKVFSDLSSLNTYVNLHLTQ